MVVDSSVSLKIINIGKNNIFKISEITWLGGNIERVKYQYSTIWNDNLVYTTVLKCVKEKQLYISVYWYITLYNSVYWYIPLYF